MACYLSGCGSDEDIKVVFSAYFVLSIRLRCTTITHFNYKMISGMKNSFSKENLGFRL